MDDEVFEMMLNSSNDNPPQNNVHAPAPPAPAPAPMPAPAPAPAPQQFTPPQPDPFTQTPSPQAGYNHPWNQSGGLQPGGLDALMGQDQNMPPTNPSQQSPYEILAQRYESLSRQCMASPQVHQAMARRCMENGGMPNISQAAMQAGEARLQKQLQKIRSGKVSADKVQRSMQQMQYVLTTGSMPDEGGGGMYGGHSVYPGYGGRMRGSGPKTLDCVVQ